MKLIQTIQEMRGFVETHRRKGLRVVLVPTMGALHDGHLELARVARTLGEVVVVSIFVNKTQFGEGEDFDAYPRSLDADSQVLAGENLADAVFAPAHEEMYPEGEPMTRVTVDRLTDHLCGISRPGHFRGVATVVTKLFTICRPDMAVFGLKDAQQFYIIRKLNADLNLGVEVVGVPTVRESDGLALSSRNQYLTEQERAEATVLYRAVMYAREAVEGGETNAKLIRTEMHRLIGEADSGRLDYAELVNSSDFHPVTNIESGATVVAAGAVYFGKARLIDNQIIEVP